MSNFVDLIVFIFLPSSGQFPLVFGVVIQTRQLDTLLGRESAATCLLCYIPLTILKVQTKQTLFFKTVEKNVTSAQTKP